MKTLLIAVLFLSSMGLSLYGQAGAGQGAILGEVKDPSGASVPKAKVEITNSANGFARTIETNEAGQFIAPTVPPASGYTISVSAAGFAAWKRNEIAVQVGQNVSINVDLAVATLSTEVEVTAASVRVDETKTEVSGVIGNREIMDLPVNGRRFDSFAAACATKERMDAAVLWTRRTRPQGLGQPHRTRFPTAPTRITVARERKKEERSVQPPHTRNS